MLGITRSIWPSRDRISLNESARKKKCRRSRPRFESLEERSLLSAGSLDPTFGVGGIANPAGTSQGIAWSMAVDSNPGSPTRGDIVAAGYIAKGNYWNIGVVRYTPSGKPDPSFGNAGTVTTVVKGYNYTEANGVAIQPDGKIVVMGTAQTGTTGGTGPDYIVARYNTNGTLDTTFGSKGMQITNIGGTSTAGTGDYARAGLLQADGKIVVAGISSSGTPLSNAIALVRYNANGTIDTTFGTGGKVVTAHTVIPGSYVDPAGKYGNTQVEGAALQPDGKILVSGFTQVTNSLITHMPAMNEPFVARYDTDGTLDTTFGSGGVAVLPATSGGGGNIQDGTIALEASGEMAVNGYGEVGLLRSDGSPDTTFGTGGVVTANVGPGPIAVQANGNILASQGSQGTVTRFLPSGAIDTAFGSAGTAKPIVGSDTMIGTQPDGKVLVASGFTIARLLPGQPEIGSFTTSPGGVTAGGSFTLSASNINDDTPGAVVTQVAFYAQIGGVDTLLGYGTQTGTGVWQLNYIWPSTWGPGTYTLVAQAVDSNGVLGDPVATSLIVS